MSMRISFRRLPVRLLIVLLALVVAPVHVQGEGGWILYLPLISHSKPIRVDTLADELEANQRCSLREAIQAANLDSAVDGCSAGSGADVIILASGVYTLTLSGANEEDNATGDLNITGDLSLKGNGAQTTIIDGNQADRVLYIHKGAHVTIAGLTIRNGGAPSGDSSGQDSQVNIDGGGIYNAGSLLVQTSLIIGNQAGGGESMPCGSAVTSGGDGGGIYNQGTLIIRDSTVHNNLAGVGGVVFCSGDGGPPVTFGGPGGRGGGIANQGIVTLTNSTISANVAGVGASGGSHGYCGGGGAGGGIYNGSGLTIHNSTISQNSAGAGGYCILQVGAPGGDGGGVANDGTVRLESSTVTSNSTGLGGSSLVQPGIGGDGGGLYNTTPSPALIAIKNTILAGNLTEHERADCSGTLTSYGYNLVQDTSGCTITGVLTSNIVGVDAKLLPLAHNGGATQTHALAPDSPAVDAGECLSIAGSTIIEDQRQVQRPQGAGCDIGAYELQRN